MLLKNSHVYDPKSYYTNFTDSTDTHIVDYIEEFEDPLTGEISYEETKFVVTKR